MKKATAPRDSEVDYTVWTAEDLELAVADILGGHGWKRLFADATGLSYSTMSRYASGELPVPQHVAVIAELLVTLAKNDIPLPESFVPKNKYKIEVRDGYTLWRRHNTRQGNTQDA